MPVALIAPSPHLWPRGSLPKCSLGFVAIASVWIPLIIRFVIDRLALNAGTCLWGNAVRKSFSDDFLGNEQDFISFSFLVF